MTLPPRGFCRRNFERLQTVSCRPRARARPRHAQPDDAHALIDGDDARLNITEAIEYRGDCGRDVLTTRQTCIWDPPSPGVFVAIGIGSEARPRRQKSSRR